MGQSVVSVLKNYLWQNQSEASLPPSHRARGENAAENVDPVPDPDARVTQNDHGSGALIPEALPNIRLLVNHELPDGSGNEHNITFHPRSTVSQLRATMETFSGIPQENIYFIFQTSLLDDNRTLYEQEVESWDRITMRDNRLTYPYPY